jgi:protein-tyrosine phosphatase
MSKLLALINKNHGTYRGYIRSLLAQSEYLLGRLDPFLDIQPHRVSRLVFVCLGNINRSAFAHALSHKYGANTFSFGLSASSGNPAFPLAIDTAERFRVDLRPHVTTDLTNYRYRDGDLLLTMEVRHAHKLLEAGFPIQAITLLGNWATPHRIHIHDPHTLSREYFLSCFTLIFSAVTNLLKYLAEENSPCMAKTHYERLSNV